MKFYSLDAHNGFADHRAWNSTSTWLSELLDGDEDGPNDPDSFNVVPIDYEDTEGDNAAQLRGFVSFPEPPLMMVLSRWLSFSPTEMVLMITKKA